MTSTPTWKPLLAITLHRDGTVSIWDAVRQQWARTANPTGEQYRAQSADDQKRISAHLMRTSQAYRDSQAAFAARMEGA